MHVTGCVDLLQRCALGPLVGCWAALETQAECGQMLYKQLYGGAMLYKMQSNVTMAGSWTAHVQHGQGNLLVAAVCRGVAVCRQAAYIDWALQVGSRHWT